MRRAGLVALTAILAIAAVAGVLAFFNSRDDATFGDDERNAPGKVDEALTDDTLRRGNVILRYSEPSHRQALETLSEEIAGPGDPALVEAGQAILVEKRAGGRILANAYKRSLAVDGPDDPALRKFVEYWLGRGAMR